jgi:hypothetical protein
MAGDAHTMTSAMVGLPDIGDRSALMTITLHSTSKIVELDGVPARIWEGTTSSGIPVHAFISRIAVDREADGSQFEAELKECRAPSPDISATYPSRLVL